ncbi:hypothetical protein POJ06DRAFT_302814 [Lipomyces tetrasporus]|uniref:Uncharacterized protein n=1 Tax=Lipomyces tetrasporus TaxID=54092 RepID=A0AAD7VQI2_9ASCO|nr:uncharacterized protein POJ06DRAFT_302814 [Lipomyces tetrasporus]KAJ8098962.1 hypothetical protein POJ06DRAFT_302814 [Lipomyces tetrasporus]
MSTSKTTFNPLPAWSEPLCITPEETVHYLRSLLLDKSEEYQRKNILFLIHLYETGQLKELRPGKITWIFDGKIVDEHWPSVYADNSDTAGSISICQRRTGYTVSSDMHEIFAKFRLPAVYGGQPNVVLDVSIANDTGSNKQTISQQIWYFWVTTLHS